MLVHLWASWQWGCPDARDSRHPSRPQFSVVCHGRRDPATCDREERIRTVVQSITRIGSEYRIGIGIIAIYSPHAPRPGSTRSRESRAVRPGPARVLVDGTATGI